MHVQFIFQKQLSHYKKQIDQLFSLAFEDNHPFKIEPELLGAALLFSNNRLIACGFVYLRDMSQQNLRFKAGIVGGVAVHPDNRKLGYCRKIMQCLDKVLQHSNVTHSFLFAYQTYIYRSLGYSELKCPIHFYDKNQSCWNSFVYRGGMVKSYADNRLLKDQAIEFKGSVY